MDGADEDGAEENPEQGGDPSPEDGDGGADDGAGAGDGGEVMAEDDGSGRGDVVGVVGLGLRGDGGVGIEPERSGRRSSDRRCGRR
jgi:hypothetical protein